MDEMGIFQAIHPARALRRLKPDPVPDDACRLILVYRAGVSLRGFRRNRNPGEGARSVETGQTEYAICCELSGQVPVKHLRRKLAGNRSVPDPIGEVKQYVAKDDLAVLCMLPGANRWRVVSSVNTYEHTASGE